MPKISVIIPAYNVEKYAAYCLDSVLNQTFTDFEIICINDGSKDNTINILNEYANKDSRVRVINQENQGCGCSRNNGYNIARGDYIYFLDSDDAIHPQFLEIMYYLAKTYNADLVCCGIECNPKKYSKESYIPENLDFLLTYNPLYYCVRNSKYKIKYNPGLRFFKKELLKETPFIKIAICEDLTQLVEICARYPKTVVIKEKLYFYSVISDSLSHTNPNPGIIYDYYAAVNRIYEIYSKPEYRQELKYIKRRIIPDILRPQLKICQKAKKGIRSEMFQIFANELMDLNNRGLVCLAGNKLKKYLIYKYLIMFKAD